MTIDADFYQSQKWLELRYRIIRENLGCCQACGARGSFNVQLHVDHIKPRSKFPELELIASNLQILCERCNFGKSNKDETNWHWMPSKELSALHSTRPETKSKLRQLSWLQVNGQTPEIRRAASDDYKALWMQVHGTKEKVSS